MKAIMKTFFCVMIFAGCTRLEPAQPQNAMGKVMLGMTPAQATIAGKAFSFKVAADDPSRHQGLGGVAQLNDGQGMIFVYDSSERRRFWMDGCLIDLDIAFLDDGGMVVAAYTMKKELPRAAEEPLLDYLDRMPFYDSEVPARFVIEVPAGTWQRLGLKVGSQLNLLHRQ